METPFAAYHGDEPYVFVCYAHADVERVFPEMDWLHGQGVRIWYDEGISAGKNWRETIGDSLLAADQILFFVSNASLNSDHCNREINLALDESKTVIPVYLDAVELTSDLKIGLSRVQALRLNEGQYRQHVLQALGHPGSVETSPAERGEEARSLTASRLDTSAQRNTRIIKIASRLGIAMLAMFALIGGWFYLEIRSLSEVTIGIVPFESLDGDADTVTAGRSLPTIILEELGQQPSNPDMYTKLEVGALSVAYQLADAGANVSEIADALNAGYMLDGSIRHTDDRRVVSVQLTRASDGLQVWSNTYEHALDTKAEAQTARHIADRVHLEVQTDFSRQNLWLVALWQGSNAEAYGYLLDGGHEFGLFLLGEEANRMQGIDYLKKAVAADPELVFAWELLANEFMGVPVPGMTVDERIESARIAIEQAQALNPESWIGVSLLAILQLVLDLDYRAAEATLKRGLETTSDLPNFRKLLAELYIREGRLADARDYLRSVLNSNAPFEQAQFHSDNAWMFRILGDYEFALKESSKALALTRGGVPRGWALRIHARSLLMLDRRAEARPFIEEAWALDGYRSPEHYVDLLADIGETERARAAQERADEPSARGYLSLGDVDAAFEALRHEILQRNRGVITSLRTAEWWEPLREDPRFEQILELLDSMETHTASYTNALD